MVCESRFAKFAALVVLSWPVAFSCGAAKLEIKKEGGTVSITNEGRPLLAYVSDNVPFKPYVRQFDTPGGFNFLRDNVPDHIHHHGLMFAIAVDGVTFWAETPDAGRQTQTSLELLPLSDAKQGQTEMVGFSGNLEWKDPKGAVLLIEKRTVTVRILDGASLLTWESRLSLPEGKDSAELSGSHYYGLGMRFPESMDNVGSFINASAAPGDIFRGDERLVNAAWSAYSGAPEKSPVTVAAFDAPRNIRHATWFSMAKPFAYMSATLNLHREPLKLSAGTPLTLKYAVAAWDGVIEPSRIEKARQTWLADLK
jgi:hypothetical protein